MKQNKNKNNKKGKSPQKQKSNSSSVAAAYSTDGATGKPRIQQGIDRIVIRHREYVGNLLGSVEWSIIKVFALNPGLAASFPWLSIQAQGWERYRFRKLVYRYITRCGSATTGSINMVPEYDPTDGLPVSEEVACSYQNSIEGSAWKDHSCTLNVKAMNAAAPGGKFIRYLDLPEGEDKGLYDSGNMIIAASDASLGVLAFGKLWVEYEVELITPQMRAGGFVYPLFYADESVSSTTAIHHTGTNIQSPSGADLPINIQGNVITFTRGGKYLISRRIGCWNAPEPGAVFTYPIPVPGNGLLYVNDGYPLDEVSNPANTLIGSHQNGGIYRVWIVQTPEKGTLTFSDKYAIAGGAEFHFASKLRVVNVNPGIIVSLPL